MSSVTALTIKDFRLLFRDKTGLFFTLVFPLIYCIFFGLIFSQQGRGTNRISVALVDRDKTDGSREFIQSLGADSGLDVVELDQDAAVNLVRKGDKAAYLVLPEGFGEARSRMFFGAAPNIELGIDPSRQAEAGMLQGLLTKAMFDGFGKMFSDPDLLKQQIGKWKSDIDDAKDMDPLLGASLKLFLPAWEQFMVQLAKPSSGEKPGGWANVPIKTVEVTRQRKGPRNSYAITFPQGIVWGVMGCAAGFGISLVTERTRGTMVRLLTSPVSAGQILAGKAMACGLSTIGLCVIILLIGWFGFGVRPQSPILLACGVFSVAIAFVGIMMLLSVLGKTEQSAGGIGWAILTILAMIGGGMIPLMFLPDFMKPLSSISPVRWSILAMEGAIWRGYTAVEMLTPCGILVGIGVVCFAVGVRAFKWTETG